MSDIQHSELLFGRWERIAVLTTCEFLPEGSASVAVLNTRNIWQKSWTLRTQLALTQESSTTTLLS